MSPLSANTGQAIFVDGSGVTQPVSVASLPLPSGGSTAANQSTEITSLSSIDTKLTSLTVSTRSDTYTGTGNGTAVNATANPPRSYAIMVTGTGATPTSWDVRLEGSLDGVTYTTLLTHTNVTGNGVLLATGATMSPTLYIRSRSAALSLGAATNIVVVILGTP